MGKPDKYVGQDEFEVAKQILIRWADRNEILIDNITLLELARDITTALLQAQKGVNKDG